MLKRINHPLVWGVLMMLAGAALVISAGALVIWRERQLGMERGKARSVTDPKA
mgnify:CR=1 FL=1